jgi:hypothetical protein
MSPLVPDGVDNTGADTAAALTAVVRSQLSAMAVRQEAAPGAGFLSWRDHGARLSK